MVARGFPSGYGLATIGTVVPVTVERNEAGFAIDRDLALARNRAGEIES